TDGLAGASGLAATGLAGFSAAAGFASSSAMIRRIDARISSIEGSWTFAGCVISDSTSKPSYLHQATKESPVLNEQAGIFIALARLVPRSGPPDASRRPPPPRGNQRAAVRRNNAGHESLSSPRQRYVMAINDCKQSARRNERRAKFFIPKVRGYVQISAAVRRANADPAVA